MSKSFDPMRISSLQTCALKSRKSKVNRADFAKPWEPTSSFSQFLQMLPNILAAGDFKKIVSAIVTSHHAGNPVVMAMGAHVIKVGLNPIVVDLMKRGILSAVALNGAGIIHDLELAMVGKTSEDVQQGLEEGAFGMARETADFLNEAISDGAKAGFGLGKAVGKVINDANLPFASESILAQAATLDIPATVHVAIGTDIIHMHPNFDPAAVGTTSHIDFRLLASVIGALEGGTYLNVGSAVVLPEVFLKALTLVRNLGHKVDRFTTVNMDFIHHYRPNTNVVCRPTSKGGTGYNLIGHHEIMLPLLAAAVIEQIASTSGNR
jgi:deoxyhypusine synthase